MALAEGHDGEVQEACGAKKPNRRRAIVVASVGLACCVVVMVAVLARGGERGSNGRAELEGMFGGAPQIELADTDSQLFPSKSATRSAARHMEAAAALLAGTVGAKADTAELDSVKPLLDAHGTLNLAAVTEAMGSKFAGSKGSLAAGETVTLHGVPTQITLTLPEDVTIAARMVRQAQEAGKTTQLVTSQSVTASGLGWAYSGANKQPKDWQYIKEDWKTCGSGLKQSPIDIVPSKAKGGEDLPPVSWECGGKPCASPDSTVAPPASDSVKLAYNGRYIELTDFVADKAPKLTSTGGLLQSIRLHTPSENAIDGQYFDLEVQLLHGESPDKIDTIVSIFFQSGGGETTPSWLEDIADVISPCHLSVVRTECQISDVPHHLTTELSFAAVALSAEAQMLHHYEYMGSLTTPPCTEGVKWLVARDPQLMNQVDWTSIAALQGKNNRPRQPRNGRDVKWV